jgi:tetratricopeptide (TPR) repeat protein
MGRQGEHERARLLYEDSLQIMRELGDTRGIANVTCNLGDTAEQQGEYQRATALYEETVRLYQELGDRTGIAGLLVGLDAVASHQQQHTRAIVLLGAVDTITTSLGVSLEPLDRERRETVSRRGRVALTIEDYQAAWDRGAAMNLEQAVELALDQHSVVR